MIEKFINFDNFINTSFYWCWIIFFICQFFVLKIIYLFEYSLDISLYLWFYVFANSYNFILPKLFIILFVIGFDVNLICIQNFVKVLCGNIDINSNSSYLIIKLWKFRNNYLLSSHNTLFALLTLLIFSDQTYSL